MDLSVLNIGGSKGLEKACFRCCIHPCFKAALTIILKKGVPCP